MQEGFLTLLCRCLDVSLLEDSLLEETKLFGVIARVHDDVEAGNSANHIFPR